MSCRNQGRLNVSTCHCHCPPGYTGRYCQGEGHLELQSQPPGDPVSEAWARAEAGRQPWWVRSAMCPCAVCPGAVGHPLQVSGESPEGVCSH